MNTAPTLLLVFGKLGPNATCPYGLTVKQPAEAEAAVAAMLASFHKLNVDDPAVFDALDVEDPDYPDPARRRLLRLRPRRLPYPHRQIRA